MSKSTIWTIIGIIILIVAAILIGVFVGRPASAPGDDSQTASDNQNGTQTNGSTKGSNLQTSSGSDTPVFYACDNNKKITAYISDNQTTLSLSEGKILVMSRITSAAGQKYQDRQYVATVDGNKLTVTNADVPVYINCVATNEGSSQSVNVFTDPKNTFTFNYPKAYSLVRDELDLEKGVVAKVVIPKATQPNTNFSEGTFSVAASNTADDVRSCLTGPDGLLAQKSQATINGEKFTKLTFTEAAAGNRYETTQYAAVRDNTCYIVGYTIHSTVFENYAPTSGIQQFNKTKVQTALESIASTFKFL